MNKIARLIRNSYAKERLLALIFFGLIYNNPNRVLVKKATNKGDGLFASRQYKSGELIFVATGSTRIEHFDGAECYKHPDWYGVDEDTWVDIAYPYVKINHSCNPNAGIFSSRCFVALKDIHAGDELTFDYSTTDEEPEWIMGPDGPICCACGAIDCRSEIGPIQNLPKEYLNKVYPYIPTYFLKKYYPSKKSSREKIMHTSNISLLSNKYFLFYTHIQMGSKLRNLLILLVAASIAVTYYSMVVKKDYDIVTNPDGPAIEEET